jgi:hypothetical protein
MSHRVSAARGAAAVLAAVVALAGLSACGEDMNSGAGPQSTPTKGSSAPAKKKNSSNSDGGAGGGGY